MARDRDTLVAPERVKRLVVDAVRGAVALDDTGRHHVPDDVLDAVRREEGAVGYDPFHVFSSAAFYAVLIVRACVVRDAYSNPPLYGELQRVPETTQNKLNDLKDSLNI